MLTQASVEQICCIGAGYVGGPTMAMIADRIAAWYDPDLSKLAVYKPGKLIGTVSGKRIGVLGFALKADTNDTRESPSIRICRDLLEEGVILQINDPKESERQMAKVLSQAAGAGECSWQRAPDMEQAASGANALLLLNEWQAFAQIDWPAVAGLNVWTVGERT